jgi:hypothetical protein
MNGRVVVMGCALVLALAACANDSSKTSLTVYEDAPTLVPVDVGTPGNSPGDEYQFYATLRDQLGGPITGHVYGTKTLVKPADPSNPAAEQRATTLFFVFANSQDQLVVAGVPDYPPNAPQFAANQPVLRAVLGGTGKYNGAGGQLTSTRNPDGSYKQEFSLIQP